MHRCVVGVVEDALLAAPAPCLVAGAIRAMSCRPGNSRRWPISLPMVRPGSCRRISAP